MREAHINIGGVDFYVAYTPGQPDRTSGPPDSWEQGYAAEMDHDCSHFMVDGRPVCLNADIWELLSERVQQKLIDAMNRHDSEYRADDAAGEKFFDRWAA